MPRASPVCFHITKEALLQTASTASVLRLIMLGKTFCGEGAVVFEVEVSVYIIEAIRF
jgi:hypothetical protein